MAGDMAVIELNLEQWPIIFSKFDGEQTIHDFEAYMDEMERVWARKELYGAIVLLKRYSKGPQGVSRFGRWLKERNDIMKTYCVAGGLVNSSAGFRFLISTVFLIQPMPIPYTVCVTLDEAVTFVRRA